MTNEERDIISQFISRVSGAQAPAQPAFGGSVPATTAPALPPVDPEADRLIGDLFTRYPAARYRITQLAFVQEHALNEAQNRIQRLEWELQQAQQAAQQAQQQQRGSGAGGGFFSGLFGGGARPAAPQGGPAWNQGAQPGYQQAPPPPQYAPGYQPGMFQQRGSGFLGSALTTAAGVAGGLIAGNALMNLFSGSHSGGGFGGGFGGGEPGVGSPWGAAPADQGYVDQGRGIRRVAAVARRIRATSTAVPGTPPAATSLRGPTTAATIPALTAAGADRATIRSEPAARACLIEFTVSAPVHALGLDAAQGLHLTESFYWDLNDRTRAFTRRVMPKTPSNTPNMIHAGCYSATLHYLKTVMDMGAGEAKKSGAATVARMKKMPVEDDCFGRTAIRRTAVISPALCRQGLVRHRDRGARKGVSRLLKRSPSAIPARSVA